MLYFYDYFYRGNKWQWTHFLNNYCTRIFSKTGFFNDDENGPVPPYFRLIKLNDIRLYHSHHNVTF